MFFHTHTSLNYAGSQGVIYNSESPASDDGVYENHLYDFITTQLVSGTTLIEIKKQCPSYMKLGTGGSYQTRLKSIPAS